MICEGLTPAQIKHMVNRFLGWRLPEGFSPDAGINFKATFNDHTPHPGKHEPIGTNLFDATQAEAMVRHMIEGLPATPAQPEAAPTEGLGHSFSGNGPPGHVGCAFEYFVPRKLCGLPREAHPAPAPAAPAGPVQLTCEVRVGPENDSVHESCGRALPCHEHFFAARAIERLRAEDAALRDALRRASHHENCPATDPRYGQCEWLESYKGPCTCGLSILRGRK